MWQSAGDDNLSIHGFNGVSASERQSLRDDVADLSGSDKAHALTAANGDLGGVLGTASHRLRLVEPLSDDEMSLLEIMRRAAASYPRRMF
jgi:hypothetical protein